MRTISLPGPKGLEIMVWRGEPSQDLKVPVCEYRASCRAAISHQKAQRTLLEALYDPCSESQILGLKE